MAKRDQFEFELHSEIGGLKVWTVKHSGLVLGLAAPNTRNPRHYHAHLAGEVSDLGIVFRNRRAAAEALLAHTDNSPAGVP